MNSQLRNILNACDQVWNGPPVDLRAFVEQLAEPHETLSPWETWTLFGLVRHQTRQAWVREIVETRLRGDGNRIAAMGALGHPDDVPQLGSVPGMPEWEYYFHGIGCCLTHKVTGEAIDVDFFDDSADYFDTYFYSNYLKSLRSPAPVEKRLRQLHKSLRPLNIAVSRLLAAGVLEPLPGRESHPYRIASHVTASIPAINAFCEAWNSPGNRSWLASLIGDWPFLQESPGLQMDIAEIVRMRADACIRLRCEELSQETDYAAADALFGLAELNAADEPIRKAFLSKPSALTSAALQIVSEQNDDRWCPGIYALFLRLNPSGATPEPHLWTMCQKILIRHGYRKGDVLASLPQAGGTDIGEAVLLALEHAPQHGLTLIRKALTSDIPINRSTVAAVLALIGKPWAVRELRRVLAESDDQEKTAEARAALLELGDPDCDRAVLEWEQKNPHEDEPGSYIEVDGRRRGPFYTMAEHSLKNRGEWIRFEMSQLHDRVMKVRDVVPAEPTTFRPWWRFWN